jgi:hypothetical protein
LYMIYFDFTLFDNYVYVLYKIIFSNKLGFILEVSLFL